jgi:hypothetical protein
MNTLLNMFVDNLIPLSAMTLRKAKVSNEFYRHNTIPIYRYGNDINIPCIMHVGLKFSP